ncbi:creatininase family protein [Paenibacillaceae bacterium WGS1546]|uniref:creatininase family protein n=1 Tax=Cohnella sp. WGS1546 TaxID=3366810 RepID=UPI00372D4C49
MRSAASSSELEKMTTAEAGEMLRKAQAAIIPIGSTEQHGGNMTMNTDTRLAVEVGRRIADALYPRLVVLPAIPVGISYHHMEFAGSMTLSPDTLQAVVFDYIRSMKKHGIRRFVFLNGHGGNQSLLSTAATIAYHELGVEAVNVFYWNLATEEIRQRASTPRYGHACEIEASFGLHLDPSIVRQGSLRKASLREYPLPYTGFEPGNKVDYPYPWKMVTDDGSLGDATKASASLGEELIGLILRRLELFLEQFLQRRA